MTYPVTYPKKIILILGGTRSGKSDFAEESALAIAQTEQKNPIYIATAEPITEPAAEPAAQIPDDEMKARIKRHIKNRNKKFTTIEEPLNLANLLEKHDSNHILLIDSIGLWITNLMIQAGDEAEAISKTITATLTSLEQTKASVILVSDETGLGIVPQNKMARHFRDQIGTINRNVAMLANKVVFMIAGLPLNLKSDS